MASQPFSTAERPAAPSVRQISVFLENRVGQLLRLFQIFHGTPVKVLALNIVHATDCAIVRLICDDTDTAVRLLRSAHFAVSETDILVARLPSAASLPTICAGLLSAEINISYVYPLLVQPAEQSAIAIQCDDIATACTVLSEKKFRLLSEDDLGPGAIR